MRAAPAIPPVELPGGRRERALAALLYALTAVALLAWLQRREAWPTGLGWPAAAALAGALLGWALWRPMAGRLGWDGLAWSLQGPSGAARPLLRLQLMLDLGGWLLLRAEFADGARPAMGWAALSAGQAGPAWQGLRLALYARATARPALPQP